MLPLIASTLTGQRGSWWPVTVSAASGHWPTGRATTDLRASSHWRRPAIRCASRRSPRSPGAWPGRAERWRPATVTRRSPSTISCWACTAGPGDAVGFSHLLRHREPGRAGPDASGAEGAPALGRRNQGQQPAKREDIVRRRSGAAGQSFRQGQCRPSRHARRSLRRHPAMA